jgi:hypothetical protein
VTVDEEDYKKELCAFFSAKQIIHYDAEYGTEVYINIGEEALHIIIPPHHKDDAIYLQQVILKEEE